MSTPVAPDRVDAANVYAFIDVTTIIRGKLHLRAKRLIEDGISVLETYQEEVQHWPHFEIVGGHVVEVRMGEDDVWYRVRTGRESPKDS